jgi:hypothetical protein
VALGLEGAVVARPSVEAQWGATIFGYLWEEGELRPAMWRLLPRRVAMVTGFAPGTGAKGFYTCTSVQLTVPPRTANQGASAAEPMTGGPHVSAEI